MNEVQSRLVSHLYRLHMLREADSIPLREWADENGIARNDAEQAYFALEESSILEPEGSGFHVGITLYGLEFAEQNGLAEPALRTEADRVRLGVLELLGALRVEKGLNHYDDLHTLAENLGADLHQTYLAVKRLELGFFIEPLGAGGHYRISSHGVAALESIVRFKGLSDHYETLLRSDDPRGRGHELEKLLGQVAEREGWSATLNVRSVGEENDIVVSSAREAWVVSCKWLKEPCEADDINSLSAKLRRRPGAHGILVSIGGFSKGAVSLAEETRDAVIVLFGKGDVEAMLYGKATFEDLLTGRWKALIERRKAEYEPGSNLES